MFGMNLKNERKQKVIDEFRLSGLERKTKLFCIYQVVEIRAKKLK